MHSTQYVSGRSESIFLFDMDGTLTQSRCRIQSSMTQILKELKTYVTVGVVSGSDLEAIETQLTDPDGRVGLEEMVDYTFSQNGTVSRFQGNIVGEDASLLNRFGEEKLQNVINTALHYIADLDLPKKRGTFIQYRTGMLNISPIGRDCSYEERLWFDQYDKQHNIRSALVEHLTERFSRDGLVFVTGGQISIDCYPEGWDKRYCLSYLSHFKHIYFFGDKTTPGQNDHTIFVDPRVHGHTVRSPDHTEQLLDKILCAFRQHT